MDRVVKSYRDLEVWQKSVVLTKAVYQATGSFPTQEKFGLVNQMRRAAVSIPSNIAEGHARSSTLEYKRFISIAMGSVAELDTQMIISADLGFLDESARDDLLQQLNDIGRMLRGLHQALSRRAKI
ncbi:MAG: four helix bundle protein [Kouleothrix sp.]|nr:four helix bundle protein [Kouleothrix sp.]